MIDYFNRERLASQRLEEAVKAADQERLASQAAARPTTRRAAARAVAARLCALALANVRRLEVAALQIDD
jgi:hypothetical protein